MVNSKQAPLGAVVPQMIQREGLFKLNVDDDVWQDLGLNDDHDGPTPLWLSNEQVHAGIRAMLDHDRCIEEETRLKKEHCSLQEWMIEEWNCTEKAKELVGASKSLLNSITPTNEMYRKIHMQSLMLCMGMVSGRKSCADSV